MGWAAWMVAPRSRSWRWMWSVQPGLALASQRAPVACTAAALRAPIWSALAGWTRL